MIEGFEEELAVELSEPRRGLRRSDEQGAQRAPHRARRQRRDRCHRGPGSGDPRGALGENEIKTLDDLGDLAGDELIEILGNLAPSLEEANAVIMMARAHWFDDEEEESVDGAEAGEVSEADEVAETVAEEHERPNV